MKINLKATGLSVTPAISDYVQKKISTIEKYLDDDHDDLVAQVEVGKTTRHHKTGNIFRAEVHITGRNLDLYAVSELDDLYAAVDAVEDEITHNALQLKGKRETLTRRSALAMKNMIKGLASSATRGFSWGLSRLRFKGFPAFGRKKKR